MSDSHRPTMGPEKPLRKRAKAAGEDRATAPRGAASRRGAAVPPVAAAADGALLQAVVDNAEMSIYSVDREYRYTSFNSRHAATVKSGHNTDLELGRSALEDLTDLADRGAVQHDLDRALAGAAVVSRRLIAGGTGRQRLVESAFRPLRDDSGKVTGVAVYSRDVTGHDEAEVGGQPAASGRQRHAANWAPELEHATRALQAEIAERRRAEAAAIAERERFNNVLETLPAYVVLLTPDYHVPVANRLFRERFGESGGRCCYEYLFGRSEPCEICETYTALKTGTPHRWEWTGPDNRNYDVFDFPFTDPDGSTLILEMGIDITERKRAEAALKEANETLERRVTERTAELAESERHLASLFHTSPTGIFVSRLADGVILDANEALFGIIGYNAAEIVGRPPREFDPWFDPAERERLAELVQQTGQVETAEVRARHKSGEMLYLLVSMTPLERSGEECLLGNVTDITERKRAEEALRESEERLKRAEQIAHLGSWELDLDTNILTWSDEVYRLFGVEPQSFGASYEAFLEAVFPDDRAAVDAAYSSSIEEGRDSYEIEHRILRKTGEVRIVHERCEHFRDSSGRIARSTGMVHDVTERRQAEAEVIRQREWLEVTLTSIGDAVLATDTSGQVTFLNPVAASLTGWSQEEAQGRAFGEVFRIVDEHTRMRGDDLVSVVLREERTVTLANHSAILTRDGREVPIEDSAAPIRDAAGNITGVVVVFHDVTEKRRAQRELHESERRYRALFNGMTEGFAAHEIVTDSNGVPCDYRFLAINPAFERLTGLAADQLVGRTVREVVPGIEPFWIETYGKVALTGEAVHFERFSQPLGSWYDVQAYSPAPRQFAAVFADVTERHQAEEKLRAALREKEVLLQEIHHRVKNNLQIIASMLNLQVASIKDEADRAPLLESQNRVRTLALIHEKLYRSTDFTSIPFQAYVADLATYVKRSYGRSGATVTLDCQVEDVHFEVATAIPLALILNELLSNAYKHAFPQGRDGRITVGLRQLGTDTYELSLADDGVGFPPDRSPETMTSMGLQLVSVLVKQLGGNLTVHREGGTKFVVTFPARH